MITPSLADESISAFLKAIDEEAPGLVEGLYLIGSLALREFRLHQSDIDFVVVTRERADEARLHALQRAHRRVITHRRRPDLEGLVVTWADLRQNPTTVAPAPFFREGRFHRAGRFALDPVTWHLLAQNGIAVRGPTPAEFHVWNDPDVLDSWARNNLETYWRNWHARHRSLLSFAGLTALHPRVVQWGVLGVTRLHYTLATGKITSKEGAGIYALTAFPARWSRLVQECLNTRKGDDKPSLYRNVFQRRSEALAYVAMVIDSVISAELRRRT